MCSGHIKQAARGSVPDAGRSVSDAGGRVSDAGGRVSDAAISKVLPLVPAKPAHAAILMTVRYR